MKRFTNKNLDQSEYDNQAGEDDDQKMIYNKNSRVRRTTPSHMIEKNYDCENCEDVVKFGRWSGSRSCKKCSLQWIKDK